MRNYELISTDSHLEVPPYNWEPYVDAEFREFVPKVVKLPNGGDGWLMPGNPTPVGLGLNFSAGRGWENLKTTGISYDEGLVGSGDAKQRLSEMDQDQVDAELLFPAVSGVRSLYTTAVPDEAQIALAAGYNDWLAEFAQHDTDRLLGLCILPPTHVDDAIAEMRRVATKPGVRGITLQAWPNGTASPNPPEDDKFWAAALELDMPLCAHITFGGGPTPAEYQSAAAKGATGNFAPMANMLSKTVTRGSLIIQMIECGYFDRFPALQFFFAETQIGWIPEFMEDADENWRRHQFWSGANEWPHEPSWYIQNHTNWGFQVDRFGLEVRHHIGIDNIQWSTDFPHVQCDWPDSRKVVEDQFKDIPDDERRKICMENAYNYFRLDRATVAA